MQCNKKLDVKILKKSKRMDIITTDIMVEINHNQTQCKEEGLLVNKSTRNLKDRA